MRPIDDPLRKRNMASGGLSHLIGAYYLLGGLFCKCDPREHTEMKQILLHLKGVYWAFMKMKFGIENPKKTDDPLATREL